MRTGVVRFGVFQLKLSSRELRKHGVPLRLSGHALSILLILLEHPGEIVTRDEIQKRLWQADTFVDFEHGLNTAIKKLRAVLSDTADSPRYIETIPRVGYRFIAPFQEASPAVGEPVPEASDTSSAGVIAAANLAALPPATQISTTKSRLLGWSLGLSAAALLLAGVPSLLVFSSSMPRVLRVRALTHSSRAESFGRLQTDGARLFFLERRGHRWSLMQMSAAGGEPQPFPNPFENMKIFAVSPDASEMIVAPFTRRDDSLRLYLMPSVGGPPRPIGGVIASDATFTPNGAQITYATSDGIYSIQRDGMNPRRLVSLAGRKDDLDWSPDGSLLRFTRGDLEGDFTRDISEIWEVDSKGSHAHAVLPGWDEQPMQCCGKWTRDGRYYAFVSLNHGGAANVWILRAQQNILSFNRAQPALLSSGPIHFDQLLPGRDGHQLFALGYEGREEYVAFDPKTREYHTLLGGSPAVWLGFSREQNWTVSRHGDHAIWKSKPDGSEAVELVSASLHPAMPAISPDGAEVVFEGDADNSRVSRLYVVPASGGQPQVLVAEKVSVEVPQWAPDRSAVVYTSADPATGRSHLYVVNRKSGERKMIAGSQGFRNTRWSPDGKYLAAVGDDDSRIALLNWSSGEWVPIAKGNVFSAPIWSGDSQSLFFQDILEEGEPVHQVTLGGRSLNSFQICDTLLNGNVLRCGFEEITPQGSLVLHLTRGDHDLYALDLKLP